jgi:hypothetical protein
MIDWDDHEPSAFDLAQDRAAFRQKLGKQPLANKPRGGPSLTEAIQAAMAKPPVPQVPDEPNSR